MTSKVKKIWGSIALFFVAGILIASILLLFLSCFKNYDLIIGGNGNLELLDSLNNNWELDEEYEIETIYINEMYAEWLHKKGVNPQSVVLQLHGGAYRRSLNYRENLYKRMAEQYEMASGAGVLTIDYRIAPENPYPAALIDALEAYNFLLDNGYSGQDIIVAGDSAGGGLALALNLFLRDNGIELPRGIITMSAWTNLNYRRKPAYVGSQNPKDPYISPIYGDFTGLPPMLMQVGTKDITKDTTEVARKAEAAGVQVQQTTYQGMSHVFQALYPALTQSCDAWVEIEAFIKNLF